MNGNAWKFSLLAVFVMLIGGQMSFYLLKLRNCSDPTTPNPVECDRLLEGYQQATDTHLQTILALMVGSGAVAAGAAAVGGSRPRGEDSGPPDPPESEDPPKRVPPKPPAGGGDLWNRDKDGPWAG